jgi:NCS1 family nucleobase:cation symporter-1
MDNAQLCNLLDLMCRQCYYVATWIIHACNRTVLVQIICVTVCRSPSLINSCRRQALLAISLGHFILAVVIVLTGTIGARLRAPFTILARSSFGFWFSYFSVISLIVLSMFWFGIQTYIGSECVYQVRRLLSHLLPRHNFCSHRW